MNQTKHLITRSKSVSQQRSWPWIAARRAATPQMARAILRSGYQMLGLAGLLVLLCPPLWSATVQTGAILFREPFGARPFALGQAYSALGDDVYGMSYNPAILSRLKESQVASQFIQSIFGTQMGYLGLASPLNPTQALGLNIAYLDDGRADIFDDNGALISKINTQRDFMAQFGYSHSFDLHPGRFHLGADGKVLRSVLAQEASATAYAADLGGLYEFQWRRGLISLGAAVSNLGPGVSYTGGIAGGSSADPLPLTTRLGLGYSEEMFAADNLGVGLEVDRVFHNDNLLEGLGVEYDYHHLCSIRFGYRIGVDLGGLSLGLGLNFKNLSIDYGIGLIQTFDSIQQFSFTYRFTVPGIRYGVQYSAGPTPQEALVRNVQKDIAENRYFDAISDWERLETFFPGTAEGVQLKHRMDETMREVVRQGPSHPRYDYAKGFLSYEQTDLKGALLSLEADFIKEPDNRETQNYLAKVRDRFQQQQKQLKLEIQARKGTLFELANEAYESGESARALRIVTEILRLGPYQPAESLKRRITEDSQRRPPLVSPPPAPKPVNAPAPAPTPQPTPQDVSRAEELYYEAVRAYAENNPAEAIEKLREGLKLDPANAGFKNTLDRIQNELKQKQQRTP